MKKKHKHLKKKISKKAQQNKKIKAIKKPKVRNKNINIKSNILLNKWIWISLAAAFVASAILLSTLFTEKTKNHINLSYVEIVVITLTPFVIFILYWGITIIAFRIIFKEISKDIERDAVFPIAESFLIQEAEISVKQYLAKGNLNKIKQLKSQTSKILVYMIVILILFIIFNFIFVGLSQLRVITIAPSWLYLFELLSNIISLILSAIFGFMVSNIINAPIQFEAHYHAIKTKLYNFKIFLNVNDLKKIDYQELKYRYSHFLPLYFYQSLLITKIKVDQYQQELEQWKYYLNLSTYLNQFSWLLFLHYSLNKQDQLKLIKKTKYLTKLADQVKKVHTILFYTQNNFLYFNNNYNAQDLQTEYNQLINILIRYQNRFVLKMITTSLEKNGLKISQTISQKKDDNIIDERDVDINFFQLNYLEYLFSIIFTTDKDAKSHQHFKY